jgi:hypothetical protein
MLILNHRVILYFDVQKRRNYISIINFQLVLFTIWFRTLTMIGYTSIAIILLSYIA